LASDVQQSPSETVKKEDLMLLLLAVILGVAWILGFGVYHVGAAGIHLLLILALAAVILHFVRGVGGTRRLT
jgi:hypothetical protein